MNTLIFRPLYQTTRKCFPALIVLLALSSSMTTNAEEEQIIHDDIDVLMPSAATEKKTDIIQASPDIASEILLWLFQAGEMYGEGEDIYHIPVLENQSNEASRKGNIFRRNIYTPTRVYLEAGESVTLETKDYPSATTQCSAHTFANFDKAYSFAETGGQVLTKSSSQVYKATIAGRLMLACENTDKDMNNWNSWGTKVTIATSGSPKKAPLYIYGLTPPSQWPSIARSPDPSGQVYLFNGRTAMAFPASFALEHADKDIDAMMREHLIITSRFDQLNGLTWQNEEPLDIMSLAMYQASFNTCCFASSNNGLIGIKFGGDQTISYWGDWHEYGHQNQLGWRWNHLGEISNNLFSLEACQMLTGKKTGSFSRCHSRYGAYITSDPESVGRFLTMDGLPEAPTDPGEKTLLMLGQLYISFPDWHAQLAKDFRIAYDRGKNANDFSTDQKKIDWFVLNTSRIVGRDLRGFFDKWELAYSATTRQAIADLELPAPIKPSLQYSSEWNISTTPEVQGTIAVPILKHSIGLVAYGREEGPTTLQIVDDQSYTRLTTVLVGTKRVPYPVVLRGTLKHGGCAEEGPMHGIGTCINQDHNVYWKLRYEPQDNLRPLPEDNYEGLLQLGIRAAYDKSWGGTLTVPLKLDVSKNQ